jgi:acetyl esterase
MPTRSPHLHPQALAFLEQQDALNLPPIQTQIPQDVRATRDQASKLRAGDATPLPRVEDLTIPGPNGDIPVRLYAASSAPHQPAVVYFHGGGFVYGNRDTHDNLCRALAHEAACTVLSVDYSLSPEARFPAAVQDSLAATRSIAANASSLHLDPTRIAVAGDSAGGNLAAVVALHARASGPKLAGQILFYPVADFSSFDTESYLTFAEGYGLTRAAMQWFRDLYLASPDQARHPDASPLLAPDLAHLPPTLILTAEFDPLRDEGEAYARRLEQAGVAVTHTRYPGMIHAFIAMRGVLDDGNRAIRQAAAFLRALSPTGS